MFHVTRLTQALALAGATLIGGNAHADAYAASTNNVSGGRITASQGITVMPTASSSSTAAALNGSGVSFNATGTNPDAQVSAVGSAAGRMNENVNGAGYYTLIGSNGTNYSWGDAAVVQEQLTPTGSIVARNAAETNIATTGFGTADGTNRSSTQLSVNVGTTGGFLSFAFNADPFMRAMVDNAALLGSVATATLGFDITLTRVEAGVGTVVFNWTPNGVLGGNGISGGTETADPFSLNQTLTATPGQNLTLSGPYAGGTFGSYAAQTNALAMGSYNLSIFMNEKTDVVRAIPEPETYALMLAGLGAMGFMARRRRKA